MSDPTIATPLPPEMLAAVTEAIVNYRRDHGATRTRTEARTDAEAALRAVDVPGLMAEIERLRAELKETKNYLRIETARVESRDEDTHRYLDAAGIPREYNVTWSDRPYQRISVFDRIRMLQDQRDILRTEQADSLRAAQSIAAELVAQRDEARTALAECEDKLDDIINCMGGDDCSGWDAPEDVWEMAQKGRTIARRVLGKEAERES